MKHFYYSLLCTFVASIVLLSGCNNNNTIPPLPPGISGGNANNGAFVCKINNITFHATYSYAVKVNNGIEISGFDSTGRGVKINLADQNPGAHNFAYRGENIGFVGSVSNFNEYATSSSVYSLNNGSCNVSYSANSVSGTFNFNTLNIVDNSNSNVTNGTLLAIPLYDSIPGSTNLVGIGSGKMHLDTVEWLPASIFPYAVDDTTIMVLLQSADGLQALRFNLYKDIMPGVYPLYNNQYNQAVYFDQHAPNNEGMDYQMLSGSTITITMHNPTTKEMKAYFNMTAKHMIHTTLPDLSINNGVFKIKYL